jgi:hypothetical protein
MVGRSCRKGSIRLERFETSAHCRGSSYVNCALYVVNLPAQAALIASQDMI